MKLSDLTKKKPPVPAQEKVAPEPTVEGSIDSTTTSKKSGFKLNVGTSALKDTLNKPAVDKPKVNPLAALSKTLTGAAEKPIKQKPLPNILDKPVNQEPSTQFSQPTMDDVSNYVFEEQPDLSTQEITAKFDTMLTELTSSLGDEIPKNLATSLKFIEAHPFIAEILKPESISHLVNAMRKSYGYVRAAKTERSKKSTARKQKEAKVLDDLADLNFSL